MAQLISAAARQAVQNILGGQPTPADHAAVRREQRPVSMPQPPLVDRLNAAFPEARDLMRLNPVYALAQPLTDLIADPARRAQLGRDVAAFPQRLGDWRAQTDAGLANMIRNPAAALPRAQPPAQARQTFAQGVADSIPGYQLMQSAIDTARPWADENTAQNALEASRARGDAAGVTRYAGQANAATGAAALNAGMLALPAAGKLGEVAFGALPRAAVAPAALNGGQSLNWLGDHGRLIRNPTDADLTRLTTPELGNELKYVSDTQGNRYVFSAADAHHNIAARALRDHGVSVESLGPGAEITTPNAMGFIFREPDGSFVHADANNRETGPWSTFARNSSALDSAPLNARLPTRASDGTILPAAVPQPIRQSLVGGSADLADAARMGAPEQPAPLERLRLPDEPVAATGSRIAAPMASPIPPGSNFVHLDLPLSRQSAAVQRIIRSSESIASPRNFPDSWAMLHPRDPWTQRGPGLKYRNEPLFAINQETGAGGAPRFEVWEGSGNDARGGGHKTVKRVGRFFTPEQARNFILDRKDPTPGQLLQGGLTDRVMREWEARGIGALRYFNAEGANGAGEMMQIQMPGKLQKVAPSGGLPAPSALALPLAITGGAGLLGHYGAQQR